MIVVENLTKHFAERQVVKGVTFEAGHGEILGFLGPNGAGKSTTMRMITGYLSPTEGRVLVGGHDMAKEPLQAKARIGYLPESPPLYPEMRVRDYLAFVARIKGVPAAVRQARVEAVIQRCWLTEAHDRIIGQLSKGYRQRVGLAQALIHDPAVLILDEPTSGLDPKQILETRELVRELASDHTIILSTHILPEVQNLCHRVLIINRGEIVAQGAPEELEHKLRRGETLQLTVRASVDELRDRLAAFPGVVQVHLSHQGTGVHAVEVGTAPGEDLREALAAHIVNQGWGLLELRSTGMSLEDIFLQLTTAAGSSASPSQEELTHV